jgi:predicted RNase H-like nuclease (RuvC/YqgF family)
MEIFLWLGGAAIGIIVALVGVIWRTTEKRSDRQDDRFHNHVNDDVKAHERLARLEQQVETHEKEITGLRNRIHALKDDVAEKLHKWFLNVMKKGE